MPHCFPFPPLGYEKKTRTDDVDLPKKRKSIERKKHKKDKDKGKDKGRDSDTSKTSTADGKRLPGQAEGLNAGKLQKEIKHDKKDVFVDNKIIKQYTGNNGEMVREINHLAKENKDSKFLLEFERRIKEGNGAAGNQLVQKFTNSDHRKDEGTVRLLARKSGTLRDDSEKLKDKGFDAKKIERKGINAQVRPFGNATVQNDTGNFHPKVDGVPKLLGKYMDRNLEATVGGKEKVNEKKDKTVGGKEKVNEKKDKTVGGKEKIDEKKEEAKEKVKEKKEEGKEKS